MKNYRMVSNSLLVLIACLGLMMSGCVGYGVGDNDDGKPDLVVDLLEVIGPNNLNPEGNFIVPIRVVVSNQGDASAGVFKLSIHFADSAGIGNQIQFKVPGQNDTHNPITSSSLAAGSDVTIDGEVIFLSSVRGKNVSIVAMADTCDEELMPEYCRVEESNEDNNVSTPIRLAFDGVLEGDL